MPSTECGSGHRTESLHELNSAVLMRCWGWHAPCLASRSRPTLAQIRMSSAPPTQNHSNAGGGPDIAQGMPALELVRIEKSFGGVRALRGASMAVRPGEIMGLCGENGAGKSTLLKVLAGVHGFGSYTGDVIVGGQVQKLNRPIDARHVGIAV